MKVASVIVLAAAAFECQASSFREPRMLMAANCDKDCSPEQGLSWTLCKLGQAGSCTWQGVSSAGSYVYHGAARLVGAHSEPEASTPAAENRTNATAAPRNATVVEAVPSSDDKKKDDKPAHEEEKEPAHEEEKASAHEEEKEPAVEEEKEPAVEEEKEPAVEEEKEPAHEEEKEPAHEEETAPAVEEHHEDEKAPTDDQEGH